MNTVAVSENNIWILKNVQVFKSNLVLIIIKILIFSSN